MTTAALFSVEEYLRTSYEPDREYLEGEVLERNVGEISHSYCQTYIAGLLVSRSVAAGVYPLVEVRVQVSARRFRVPDVVVVKRPLPAGRIITTPPLIVIEILSPEDRYGYMQDKLADYFDFGVPNVWLIDPERRRGFVCTRRGLEEPADGVLRTQDGAIELPAAEIFAPPQ
ncbi:MAG: Uma2 family endonuclease [Acidobacteria bacterium]|nr:Uma2 family endonuclease [Acidobacteriota bacterium]